LLDEMSSKMRSFRRAEGMFTAIYIGSIFIIIGLIYYNHLPTSLWVSIINFFSSLALAQVPGTGIYLPAPITPAVHVELYGAAFQFCIALGIVEVTILVLRFLFNSPLKRMAETVENVVFWFGASYLVATYLNDTASINKWFVFWTGIIMIFGLSLIARAFVLLAARRQPAPPPPQHKVA
jgi:Na+/H+-dicarboxylate symporter